MARNGTGRWYSYNYGTLPSAYSTSPSGGAYHWSFYATFVVGAAPTDAPTQIPSTTSSPSDTPTPISTPVDSSTPARACNIVSHGAISILGSTMSMTINNPTGMPLLVQDVTVHWNHDAGHQFGGDRTLRLIQADLDGDVFFSNTVGIYASSYTITPSSLYIPPGSSTIVFTFHQTYTKTDGTELILINLATNGCQDDPIDSSD